MHIIGKKYLKNVKDDIRIYILGQIVGLSAIFIRKQTPAHEFIRIEVKNQAWHTKRRRRMYRCQHGTPALLDQPKWGSVVLYIDSAETLEEGLLIK